MSPGVGSELETWVNSRFSTGKGVRSHVCTHAHSHSYTLDLAAEWA